MAWSVSLKATCVATIFRYGEGGVGLLVRDRVWQLAMARRRIETRTEFARL